MSVRREGKRKKGNSCDGEQDEEENEREETLKHGKADARDPIGF